MKKIWLNENPAFFFALLWVFLIGQVFGNWIIAISLPLTGYIAWLYYRIYKLENWLARGSKNSEVFDDNGLIGLIVRHLYRQKKLHSKRKKRMKGILRRLNTNISALPDATVLLNKQFEIEWCNAPASYLLGINYPYDVGQRISNLIRQPKFLRYLIKPDKKSRLDIESPIDNKIILQIRIVRFGKNQRLLVARDTSEQKQLQEALKNFVANASHELQTPLTAIIGHLELLGNESGLSDTARKSIVVAQQQSQRMNGLIKDLLMLSRVESYQLQSDEGEQLSITEIMSHVMLSVSEACNIDHIVCNIPDGLYLLGIKSEVESICINLIKNAIKHTPDKTPVQINWSINEKGEYVFSVSDQGPGISEQELPYVTDRYYRGSNKTANQISGSGLGLAIVRQVAHKHGAKLNIKSKLSKGSTFSVTFPKYRIIRIIQSVSNL